MPELSASPAPDLRAIEDRLARIEARLDRLGTLLERVEPLAVAAERYTGIAIDVADEELARAQARGVDLDQRLHRTLALVEKLTAPAVLADLERAASHSRALAEGAELAAAAPAYAAIAIDVVDEEVARMQAEGIDVDRARENLVVLVRALAGFLSSPAASQLIGSGLLKPETLNRITQLSTAVVQTLNEEPEHIGPWGSFVRTWDRRFQRFAGFSFALAHRVGALLGPEHGRITTTIHD